MRNLFLIAAMLLPMFSLAMGGAQTAEFKVNGNCGGCKATIEKAAMIEGVSEAEWSVETKMLTLTYCPATVNLDDVHQKIADAGYSTEKVESAGTECGAEPAKEERTVRASDDGGC